MNRNHFFLAILSAVKAMIEKSEKNILYINAVASAKRSLQYDFNKKN